MCQYDTDAPAQGPSSPTSRHFAKNEVEKRAITHNNWQILPEIEFDLYFMIIYLCIKYESNTPIFLKKISKGKHFLKVKMGHNSHNNGWILPLIELDLYFMIINLCIKYESNTLMFVKDIKRKLFFNIEKGA